MTRRDANLVSPVERVLYLRSVPPIGALPLSDLAVLAEHAVERFFPAGSVLIAEDRPVSAAYSLISGEVEMVYRGRGATVEPPEWVGLLPLLGRVDGGVVATAISDTTALEVRGDALLDLMESNVALAQEAIREFSGQILEHRGSLPVDPTRAGPVELGTYRERPMNMVERLHFVANTSGFAEANLDAIVPLSRKMEELRYPPGTVIWDAGEPASYALNVLYGRVRCSAGGESVHVGADFGLGYLDAVGFRDRSYSAVAETEVIALRFWVEDLLGVTESYAQLGVRMVSGLANSLLEAALPLAPEEEQAAG